MDIANDGQYSLQNPRFGSYEAVTYRGRDADALDNAVPLKRATLTHWPREALHVWNLVYALLGAMGYVNRSGNSAGHCLASGDALEEILTALEESEERAGQLAAEVAAYRDRFGALTA